jgi:hypothetical protein
MCRNGFQPRCNNLGFDYIAVKKLVKHPERPEERNPLGIPCKTGTDHVYRAGLRLSATAVPSATMLRRSRISVAEVRVHIEPDLPAQHAVGNGKTWSVPYCLICLLNDDPVA